jgi:hypothetical protein
MSNDNDDKNASRAARLAKAQGDALPPAPDVVAALATMTIALSKVNTLLGDLVLKIGSDEQKQDAVDAQRAVADVLARVTEMVDRYGTG